MQLEMTVFSMSDVMQQQQQQKKFSRHVKLFQEAGQRMFYILAG